MGRWCATHLGTSLSLSLEQWWAVLGISLPSIWTEDKDSFGLRITYTLSASGPFPFYPTFHSSFSRPFLIFYIPINQTILPVLSPSYSFSLSLLSTPRDATDLRTALPTLAVLRMPRRLPLFLPLRFALPSVVCRFLPRRLPCSLLLLRSYRAALYRAFVTRATHILVCTLHHSATIHHPLLICTLHGSCYICSCVYRSPPPPPTVLLFILLTYICCSMDGSTIPSQRSVIPHLTR